MRGSRCGKCGSAGLVSGPASVRCPVCGGIEYGPGADKRQMWAEHRLGLLYAGGGWRWLDVLEPPAWFIENVV